MDSTTIRRTILEAAPELLEEIIARTKGELGPLPRADGTMLMLPASILALVSL